MNINLTQFNNINVIDTCAIWNIISCPLFFDRAIQNKCFFSMTQFVEYESLIKTRSNPTASELRIQNVLRTEIRKGSFKIHPITIADIQDSDIVKSRKSLGIGELSSIAFARKISQCFLTDDQPARRFASTILGNEKVQTTPHLLGYLIFQRIIIDGELDQIIKDHNAFDRPLEKFFREVYNEALRIRLLMKI